MIDAARHVAVASFCNFYFILVTSKKTAESLALIDEGYSLLAASYKLNYK
jgi:hypothetical protein